MNVRNSYCNSGASGSSASNGNGQGPVTRIITGVKLNECHQLEMA